MAGAGTIREKGNGWEIRVSTGRGLDGKYGQRSRYITGTKHDAEQALLRLRLEVGDGVRRGDNATVADLLTTHLSLAAGDLAETTHERYSDLARLHLIPAIGTVPLRKLDASLLDRFFADLVKKKGLSPTTVKQVKAVLSAACTEAMRWGWITTNPAKLARVRGYQRHEIDPPAGVDVIRIIEAARELDDDFADFLTLAAVTGCRRGELAAIQWVDVDHASGLLSIRRVIIETKHGPVVKDTTKTRQSRRLALDPATLDLISSRELRCKELAFAVGKRLGPWMFGATVDHATPVPPDRMTGRWTRLVVKLGLKGVRLHDLRHYAATFLIDAGVPLATVSKRLGHGQGSTTINLYAHAIESTDRAAADMLGASVRRKETASR